MKKYFKTIVSLIIIFLAFGAQAAFAGGLYQNMQIAAGTDLQKNADLVNFIGSIVGAVLAVLGVVLVLVIIYAGITWGFLSNGEAAKIQKAKDMLKNAVIGIIIVFAAYGITSFVMSSLTKTTSGSSQPSSPTDTVCGPGGC